MGKWKWTAGEWYADPEDKGIKTSEDARHYGLSAKLSEPFTNKDKELVVQFSVKHEQDLDCGGAYIKLLGDIDQDKFGGSTPYQIMFGPDICGPSNRRTHVIFHYPPKNDNLLIKNDVQVETDRQRHLYTLVVKPDNTYEVLIDLKSVKAGKLEDDWNFLLPKTIKDPSQKKPDDWVDAKKIPDPDDKKPEGYDDIPAEIPDPEATKPEDWDDEEDGEWEPPLIDNPAYKGPWKPKMIKNPDYKGEWVHPEIPNPDYKEDPNLYIRCQDCTHIGFELWQVKSGTVFDDIIVTDSFDQAKEYAESTFVKNQAAEKAAYEAAEKARTDAAKAAADEAKGDEGEEDDEDDHDEL
jgi:calreticulin